MRVTTTTRAGLAVTALPALRDNYIWGLRRTPSGNETTENREAALVDPGEAAPALAWLAENRLDLVAILITHHHADHQGGVRELKAKFPAARVLGPGRESITARDEALVGGEAFSLLGARFEVLDVAAHTRGHLAYHAPEEKLLFCGDTLFGAGCGKLFEGAPEDMCRALAKIASLPDDTLIFCAHEYTCFCLGFAATVEPANPAIARRLADSRAQIDAGRPTVPSTLALEKATNPFLRLDAPDVVAALAAAAPQAAQTSAGRLALLLDGLDRY